jgi:hypothetical protein
MNLLQALKFVAGAVAKSDYIPALRHIALGGGYAVSFNGTLALCAPIVLDLSACPRADIFARAIAACKEPAQLHLSKQGLIVKSGALHVTVPCTTDAFPQIAPEGFDCTLPDSFLQALKALAPFVCPDTSRQAFNGILLRGASAYATNKTILVEYWHGSTLPVDINLPLIAVQELLRIGDLPVRAQISERSATFHYADCRWLRTILYPTTWPPSLTQLLSHSDAQQLPDGFFVALEKLAPFGEEVRLEGNQLATEVASFKLSSTVTTSRFTLKQLLSLESVATAITFSDYPQPCRFVGENTRGVILGLE